MSPLQLPQAELNDKCARGADGSHTDVIPQTAFRIMTSRLCKAMAGELPNQTITPHDASERAAWASDVIARTQNQIKPVSLHIRRLVRKKLGGNVSGTKLLGEKGETNLPGRGQPPTWPIRQRQAKTLAKAPGPAL
jgi:hypothetical protein